MEYVLHVFVVLKLVEQLFDLCALLIGDFLELVGYALKVGTHDLIAVFFEVFLYVGELLECAVGNDFLFVGFELVDAVVDEFKFEFFEIHSVLGFDLEDALVVEKECE